MELLELREHTIETRAGTRVVVSLTPKAPIVFSRSDLHALQSASRPSPRDREILQRLAARDRRADVFVFQSQASSGPGCWHFADDLSDGEASELGFQIVRTHRFVYRGLVDAGINMAIGAAKGYRELECLRQGTRRFEQQLARDLGHLTGVERCDAEADLFLVRHLMVFTSLHLPQLLKGVIPDKLPLCERRAPKFREIRERARSLSGVAPAAFRPA